MNYKNLSKIADSSDAVAQVKKYYREEAKKLEAAVKEVLASKFDWGTGWKNKSYPFLSFEQFTPFVSVWGYDKDDKRVPSGAIYQVLKDNGFKVITREASVYAVPEDGSVPMERGIYFEPGLDVYIAQAQDKIEKEQENIDWYNELKEKYSHL